MAKKRTGRQPIPAPETMADMPFPVQGVDVSTEYELQPAQTTPVGLNVRGYEPSTMRRRGGSRPGIGQYIPATVSGTHLIQHLNYIVDPGGTVNVPGFNFGDGLLTNTETETQTFPDPSTNNNSEGFGDRNDGRMVRPGGSGVAHNRHIPALVIHPATLPNGTTGNAYAQGLSATGGTAPYTWKVVTGGLPNGLTLNPSSGIIAGTPTFAATFPFIVQATDAHGLRGRKTYSIMITAGGGSGGYVLNQQAGTNFSGTGPHSLTFSAGVDDGTNDIILVCVVTLDGLGPPTTITISDNLGNGYSAVTGYIRVGTRTHSEWDSFTSSAGAPLVLTFTTNNPFATVNITGETWTGGDGVTVPPMSNPCV